MKSFAPSIFVLVLCFGLSSCIEFENQKIIFNHNPENDELHLVIRYQGIFGNLEQDQNSQKSPSDIASKDSLNQKQIEQIESVLQEKRAFFFSNWIFEYSPKTLPQLLEDIIKRNDNGRFDKPEQDLIKALIENVELQNVGFYKNGQGQLCGAQTLNIQNFSKVIELSNHVIRRQTIAHIPQMREEGIKGNVGNAVSEESIQFLEKKMKDPYSFIQMNGNLLTFQFPNLYSETENITLSLLKDLPQGANIRLKNGNVTIEIGAKNEASGKVTKKCFDGYVPNAKNYLEENHKQLFLKSKQVDTRLRKFLAN